MIRLQTLGALDLRASDGGSLYQILRQPKRLALLAYLAIEKPGQFHRRDHLLGLFWPEQDENRGRAALSQAIHKLRQGLGKDVIINRGDEEIGVDSTQLWCDAAAFQQQLANKQFADAIALYQGELFPGFFLEESDGFEHWLEQKREELKRCAMRAATALADAAEAKSDYDDVVLWLRRAISYFPYDETLHRRLIAALDGAGDRAAALRAYEELEQVLRTEFESEPSAETRSLIESVRSRSEAQPVALPLSGPMRRAHDARGIVKPPRSRRALIASVASALLIATVVVWGSVALREPQPTAPVNRIAVLFFNTTQTAELGHIAEGLTTSLIDQLGQVRQIEVISQNGVRPFRGDSIPVDSIARQLDVGTIVGGSISQSGDVLRVTVEMIKGANGVVVRTRKFERPAGELFALLDDVTNEVGSFLRVSLGEEVKLQQYRSETRSVEAWQTLHLGETALADADDALARGDSIAGKIGFARAESLFTRAGRLDRKWAAPVVGRSRGYEKRAWYALLTGGGPAAALQLFDRAEEVSDSALQRDQRSAAAYEARGIARFGQWTFAAPQRGANGALLGEAERDLVTALRLAPDRVRAQSALSFVYDMQGRFAQAREAAQRALDADPYLSDADQIVTRLFETSFETGDESEAGHWCDEIRRRMSGRWPGAWCDLLLLGWSTSSKADERKALYILETFGPRDAEPMRRAMRPRLTMLAAAAVARAGDSQKAEEMIKTARDAAPYDPELLHLEAAVRMRMGDLPRAESLLRDYLVGNPNAKQRVANRRIFEPLRASLLTRTASLPTVTDRR